jgi:hypothetical protein
MLHACAAKFDVRRILKVFGFRGERPPNDRVYIHSILYRWYNRYKISRRDCWTEMGPNPLSGSTVLGDA